MTVAVILWCEFAIFREHFYPKLEKPSNSFRNNFEKELVMTLRNIELLSFSVSFSFTSMHFPAILKCYKIWGKASKSKFALNSIFTILALARFFLSTVDLLNVTWCDIEIYPP